MPEPNLMPLQQAASDAGLHPSTLHRYIKRGLLKRWRRGGDTRTYIDRDELARLLEFRPVDDRG